MKIIVQKFGGTSLNSDEIRTKAINKVLGALKRGYNPVVVVSAMGRRDDAYSTDALLNLISNKKIKNRQIEDLLMCSGEIISSAVFSLDLINNNIKSLPLTAFQAGIVTDDNFKDAVIKNIDCTNILNLIEQGYVPVVTGFQGITEEGYYTTLGRGGSDTTAIALGVSLKAKYVEIFTDVNGVMTADPKLVKDAHKIEQIDYDELFQLADQGAKVINARAIEIAKKNSLLVYIRNTFSSDEGTLISSNITSELKPVTSITSIGNRIQVIIYMNNKNFEYDKLLLEIASRGVSLDLINVSIDRIMFTIDSDLGDRLLNILSKYDIDYEICKECSKISVIGIGMKGVPGIMARIITSLNKENIDILQTADSYMTIWCLVKTYNLERALNLLHKEFSL
ncbi:MAG: aspartate kinase [Clostridium sp.]|nr:aspartate kinase [Clostridium sp.]